MKDFESSLIIKSEHKKEFHLLNTKDIILTKDVYAIYDDYFNRYLYTFSNNRISVHRLFPYSKIKEIECKLEIKDILVYEETVICITDDLLVRLSDNKKITGDFRNCKLEKIYGKIGVQHSKVLEIYNQDLEIEDKYDCSHSFYQEDVLLVSYNNRLNIILKKENISFEIFLPESISCLQTDIMFGKIYCGTESGKIYCVYTDGSSNEILDYHKSCITSISFSFCNRYLYTSDLSGLLCVWDVEYNVVIDKINLTSNINKITAFYTSNFTIKESLPLIKD